MSTTPLHLQPCPWCGSQPVAFFMPKDEDIERDWAGLQCEADECPANPMVSGADAEQAAQKWNDRRAA